MNELLREFQPLNFGITKITPLTLLAKYLQVALSLLTLYVVFVVIGYGLRTGLGL